MPIIKRYSNRKLYDTEAKRYITLDGIAELIRRGEEVHVIDHETGDDLTTLIQAQIIVEEEKKIGGGLPRSALTDLIRTGSHTLSHLRQALTPPADWKAQVDAEIERRMQALIQQGSLLEDDALRLLDKLLGFDQPAPEPPPLTDQDVERALRSRDLPSRTDLDRIAHQIEALSAELDQLVPPRDADKK